MSTPVSSNAGAGTVSNTSTTSTTMSAKPKPRIFGRIMGGNEARMRYRAFGTPLRKAALIGAVFGTQILYAAYRDIFVHGL